MICVGTLDGTLYGMIVPYKYISYKYMVQVHCTNRVFWLI